MKSDEPADRSGHVSGQFTGHVSGQTSGQTSGQAQGHAERDPRDAYEALAGGERFVGPDDRHPGRVDLSLDGRQVFFLFFGSAVLACLLFVSGVLVGRRIEQRAATPAAGVDPLAELDEREGESDPGLTFPAELVQRKRQARESAARTPARRDDEPRATAATTGSGQGGGTALRPPATTPGSTGAAGGATAARRDSTPSASAAEHHDTLPTLPRPPGQRFCLQLSAFADRSDAELFAAKVGASGLQARVVESRIEGRGTFYRVRAGDYGTRQEAVQAKEAYDRTHPDPAMVATE